MEPGRDAKRVKQDKRANYDYMTESKWVSRKAWAAFHHVPYTAVNLGQFVDTEGIERSERNDDTNESGTCFSLDEPYGCYYDSLSYEDE